MLFPTVSDQHETNYVSPASTRFQPDIQSLASPALLFPTPLWQERLRISSVYQSAGRLQLFLKVCDASDFISISL
jgi:hypothetical protein